MALLLALAGLPAAPTLYYVVGPSAGWSDPTGPQIFAGVLGGGGTASARGSELSPTSSATFDFAAAAAGLTPGTAYKVAFVWFDGTEYSNVAVSAAITTASASVPALTLVGGTWVQDPVAGLSALKMYLTSSGALVAKTSASSGDRLVSVVSGSMQAGLAA